MGIPDGLIRVSVGIEAADDIMADMANALAAI
jgi:cystathionine beta-lyase/cystathionine gamma-synthase